MRRAKSDVARRHLDAECAEPPETPDPDGGVGSAGSPPEPGPPPAEAEARPTRFHGGGSLDATRTGRDASRIADEVITYLAGLVGSNVTLEIEADMPTGAPDHAVRTVTENSRTLKFDSHGFERE